MKTFNIWSPISPHSPRNMSAVHKAPHASRQGGPCQAAVSAAKEKQTRHELEMARANNRREIEVRRT